MEWMTKEMSGSEKLNKKSLVSQKQQISRILDLEPNIQLQNAAQASVLVLNSNSTTGTNSLELPLEEGVAREQYLEMTSIEFRRRNWSTSSCDSSDVACKPLYGNKEIIYHELEDDDTIAKLALKYNCKISEMKHANKIYNEKELHALRTIKVPVVKDGYIYEQYIEQQQNKNTSEPNGISTTGIVNNGFYGDRKDQLRVQTQHEINPGLDFLPSSDDEDYDIFDRHDSEKRTLLSVDERTITIGQPIDNAEPTLADFMERVDIRIQNEIKDVNSQKENMDKVVDALLSPVVFPPERITGRVKYGTAFFCSWKFYLVLGFAFVLFVVVPLLYYYHFHHDSSS